MTGGITAISCAITALAFALLGFLWAAARGLGFSRLIQRNLPPLIALVLSALLCAFGSVTFVSFVRSNRPQDGADNSTQSFYVASHLSRLASGHGGATTEELALYSALVRTRDARPSLAWFLSMISIPLNVVAAILLWADRNKDRHYEALR